MCVGVWGWVCVWGEGGGWGRGRARFNLSVFQPSGDNRKVVYPVFLSVRSDSVCEILFVFSYAAHFCHTEGSVE